MLVLDASAALAFCFEDEAPAGLDDLVETIRQEGALAPHLWSIEVPNALIMAERRGRITAPDAERFWTLVTAVFDVQLDRQAAVPRLLALARSEHLSVYDATYLELAIRQRAPLATLDRRLATAARRHGVGLLPQPHWRT